MRTPHTRRPLIGVTGPDKGGLSAWLFTALAVTRAGGRPCRITPDAPCDPDTLDGLILGGGSDVDPRHYGQQWQELEEEFDTQQRRGLVRRLVSFALFPLILVLRLALALGTPPKRDPERDDLELFIARRALGRGIPMLGICRGAQLLNVVRGGDLHQDLSGFYQETPNVRSIFPRKRVMVPHNSLLGGILGPGEHRVNALHSQAVYCLGDGLTIAAQEVPAGVVQAVEDSAHPFLLGVQWHPEFLPQVAKQQRIFRRLVAAALADSDS